MAELTIASFPDDLHQRLEARAVRNHRTTTGELVAILEEALKADNARPTLEEIDRRRVHGAKPLTDEIIREAPPSSAQDVEAALQGLPIRGAAALTDELLREARTAGRP